MRFQTFVHYAAQPIDLDFFRKYKQEGNFKPNGLWFSVEGGNDGWQAWCEAEEFRLDCLRERHWITLDMRRIKTISSTAELRQFHHDYRSCLIRGYIHLDWKRVKLNYAGIVIAPYQWSMRFDHEMLWYYSWDCASGCVWDLSAVDSWRHMPTMSVTDPSQTLNLRDPVNPP